MKEDISLYLILFERQACMTDVPKEFWVSHLLGLLPQEITQLIFREDEQEARDYDHVRSLLLKRFKLTPEKLRQLFVTHQRSLDKTWRDFYLEVQTFFNGWIEDTGSTVSLIREDISTQIVDHSRLYKINTVLYGLGQTEVRTKGSFEYDFVLDKDQYSLTWHVVPTKQLTFEAIIGTDILGQASLNFTQEGVMFHKHEEKACQMQISGVHPEF
ncbi:homeotic protein female sterile [Trichonephila clavipes]|nr:homeotic protein female sterile [Trichonephila clavipes]